MISSDDRRGAGGLNSFPFPTINGNILPPYREKQRKLGSRHSTIYGNVGSFLLLLTGNLHGQEEDSPTPTSRAASPTQGLEKHRCPTARASH